MTRRDHSEILAELVAADEATDTSEAFVLTYTALGPVIVGHPGWPQEQNAPTTVEIDELEELGWVKITKVNGSGRVFTLTIDGRNTAKAHARQRAAADIDTVSLDWRVVTPVLDAVYAAYVAAGAPEHGVESAVVLLEIGSPKGGRAALRELVRGGYLEALTEVEQSDIPLAVRPTTSTLHLLAGWPRGTADAALGELVAALDDAIARTPMGDERSKLENVRDGLAGVARDTALAYFDKKVCG
jgi:hypothetical protein